VELILVPLAVAILALELDNRFRLGRLLQWTIDHDKHHNSVVPSK
jgi:hypothetical protein